MFVFDESEDRGFGLYSVIVFDAILSEVHTSTAMIAKHAIELGADITDYVRPEQTKITLEAFVTNTPTQPSIDASYLPEVGKLDGYMLPTVLQGSLRRWVNGAQIRGGGAVLPIQTNGFPPPQNPITAVASQSVVTPNIVGGMSLQFPRQVDRCRVVYEQLKRLCANGVEIVFFSTLADYPSMYISSISAPKTNEDSLTFSIELVSVDFAETKFVNTTKKVPAEKRAVVKAPVAEVPVGEPFSPTSGLGGVDTGRGTSTSWFEQGVMSLAEPVSAKGS